MENAPMENQKKLLNPCTTFPPTFPLLYFRDLITGVLGGEVVVGRKEQASAKFSTVSTDNISVAMDTE